MVAKEKNVRHPWNFAGAWNLMSRAEQPWGGGGGVEDLRKKFSSKPLQ